MKVGILSVVPSPYQRDLFAEIAALSGIELEVFYLEQAAPDSPWPDEALAEFEQVLPGKTIGKGRVRCHHNWQLPDPHDFDAFILNTAITGLTTQRMLRRLSDHPCWFFWGEILRQRTGLKGLIQRLLARKIGTADAIVAIGEQARGDYQKRFPNARVEELPYFCSLDSFRDKERARTSAEPVFLFCGQMIERKGFDLLLEAFGSLRNDGVHARLLLAGRPPDPLPVLPEGAELVGFTAPEELPQLFSRADVFVLPSRHDGWGVVINQALGAGLPIISTTAVGAARDLVDDGVNGLLVEPGETAPLREAMKILAENPELREKMAAASSDLAENLDPSSGAQRWFEILSS